MDILSLLQEINPPNPGIKPRSPTLQVDSVPAEPPGMPQNTGVGSLSILPGDLPDPGIKPGSPALQADSSPAELPGKHKSVSLKFTLGSKKTKFTLGSAEHRKGHFPLRIVNVESI